MTTWEVSVRKIEETSCLRESYNLGSVARGKKGEQAVRQPPIVAGIDGISGDCTNGVVSHELRGRHLDYVALTLSGKICSLTQLEYLHASFLHTLSRTDLLECSITFFDISRMSRPAGSYQAARDMATPAPSMVMRLSMSGPHYSSAN